MATQTLKKTPRPYQASCVEAVVAALDPFRDPPLSRVIYALPTGAGKTVTFAELARIFLQDRDTRILILAHRLELITQAYRTVRDHCGLTDIDMGVEQAQFRTNGHERVIVGCISSVAQPSRLNGWRPTVIIADESHRAAGGTWQRVFDRYGVKEGECSLIGCTATAWRTDRKSLYALDVNGNPLMVEEKNKKPRLATAEDSIFEQLVYEYPIFEAIEDGWLVPIRGKAVPTETSLDNVKTRKGDFVEAELAKAVDNAKRTILAINAWKEVAIDRPTLAFCVTVEHAHHSAQLWREAGFSAVAIDGTTDTYVRQRAFNDFHEGRLQVICNVGVFTEGADVPRCSCIVHLRPTKSKLLYSQCSGRATRPLEGIVDPFAKEPPERRRQAIAESGKPDALIIDMCDVYKNCGELCATPVILGLSAQFDLEGHSVTEAKKLLDRLESDQEKKRFIGEAPLVYTDAVVLVNELELLRNSGAESHLKWRPYSDGSGFNYSGLPPSYRCNLFRDGDMYRLRVTAPGGNHILSRHSKPDRQDKEYLDEAARQAHKAVEQHRANNPKNYATWDRLSPKQRSCLTVNGHTREEIDKWTYGWAKKLIGIYYNRYHGKG